MISLAEEEAAEGQHARQGVVDLVSDPGRQAPERGQLLGLQDRPLGLVLELAVALFNGPNHGVEPGGDLSGVIIVARPDLDRPVVPAGDVRCGGDDPLDRLGGGVDQVERQDEGDQNGHDDDHQEEERRRPQGRVELLFEDADVEHAQDAAVDVAQGAVAGDIPGSHDERLTDPGLAFLVNPAIDLLGDLGPDGPLAQGVDDVRRHPDVAQEERRGPDFAAVDALLLEDETLEAVDELVVVVEEDGGVQDPDHSDAPPKSGRIRSE
jgi:hypothetical protein